MSEWLEAYLHPNQLIRTGLLLALLILVRWLIIVRLRKVKGMSNDMRRRWAAQVRMALLFFALLGLMMIWGSELRTFAVSVVAIAAAIVIATKELIMCVSGSVLKASGRSFQIGDRVELGDFRGDVVDQTLLTTTILEVGPGTNIHQHTGRTIVVPNSLLLSAPVINETFSNEYVLHVFSVPTIEGEQWNEAEAALLDAARTECAPFQADAERHMLRFVQRQGLESLSVEPRVSLHLNDSKSVVLLARIAVPARRRGRVEQAILRNFLEWRVQQQVSKDQAPTDSGSTTSS
ncbi:MAG: mechanosensitive ion channel [Phycisphaerales bacterium]|nr:mechanosensitive ion channel [Phycisphaerales bacterium]